MRLNPYICESCEHMSLIEYEFHIALFCNQIEMRIAKYDIDNAEIELKNGKFIKTAKLNKGKYDSIKLTKLNVKKLKEKCPFNLEQFITNGT